MRRFGSVDYFSRLQAKRRFPLLELNIEVSSPDAVKRARGVEEFSAEWELRETRVKRPRSLGPLMQLCEGRCISLVLDSSPTDCHEQPKVVARRTLGSITRSSGSLFGKEQVSAVETLPRLEPPLLPHCLQAQHRDGVMTLALAEDPELMQCVRVF